MPIYTGKGIIGEPGFEMHEFRGMYISPCGKYWSSNPWTKEDDQQMRRMEWKERVKNLRKNK